VKAKSALSSGITLAHCYRSALRIGEFPSLPAMESEISLLIKEAQEVGARQSKACEIVGISELSNPSLQS
jgi:predicted ester cyclase